MCNMHDLVLVKIVQIHHYEEGGITLVHGIGNTNFAPKTNISLSVTNVATKSQSNR